MAKRNLHMLPGLLFILIAVLGARSALAQPELASAETVSPIHPTFALLDQAGANVLTSGNPVSTMETCGQCHDTEFIQGHALHSDLGLSDYAQSGGDSSSPGTFGKWDPLTYRYLSLPGDERLDLSTAGWLMLYGDYVVGGGPATTSRSGVALIDLESDPTNPETNILDPETGYPEAWNWHESGTMEMNCFLCHMDNPNHGARSEAIRSGHFELANTATLFESGLAIQTDNGFEWDPTSFQDNGNIKEDLVFVKDPTNENCAACHGEVHTETDQPLLIRPGDLNLRQTATTGQVISAQRIADSGMNFSGKNELNRAWDIHAERQLDCTDCHYSLNNPTHAGEVRKNEPTHLLYDPRTLEIGEYLERPEHNFARGQSAQYNVAPELKGTMRRCESCHDARKGHADWLPYMETHMAVVACETCHIPQLYAPAIQSYDWTVLTLEKQPLKTYRGIQGDPDEITSLVTGYQPVLLNRTNMDGQPLLAPYNLITTYYWGYEDANGNKRPVRLLDLERAFFENMAYAPGILSTFDADHDGSLDEDELVIDSAAKETVIKERLAALGLNNPHIEGLTQPYSVNHNVTRGEDAVNECRTCHSAGSRVSQSITLSSYAPNGVTPVFDTNNNVNPTGEITISQSTGAVHYTPIPANDDMYLFGSSRVDWIDWLGSFLFAGTVLGVAGHGTLRYIVSRKRANGPFRTERIFMYQAYERFWHWLQTVAIVILLCTGLVIHRPDIFGAFSFAGIVMVHNVIAAVLAVNAVLALFYHLSTETIRRYIPHPHGFFDDTFKQLVYYTRGIFEGGRHPFEKTPGKRLNPLQQATYFMILHVLLPLQGLTGILMWGVQKWPNAAHLFGGLPFLAPFHSLVAWTFASFIVAHVYLTTTGATPLEAMRGMVTGYEEVEVHEHVQDAQQMEEVIASH